MLKPFFSVVLPNYERVELLNRALESLVSQSFKHFEVHIVDDGSKNIYAIKSILNQYQSSEEPSIYFHRLQSNQGVSFARNYGIRKATADWICFLDSDDTWDKNKLIEFKQAINQNPLIPIFHSNEKWLFKDKIKKQNLIRPSGMCFNENLEKCAIGPSTACVHKSLFYNYGFFNETYSVCEDFDLWLKLTTSNKVFLVQKELTTKYAGHNDQLSFTTHSMDLWRIRALYFQMWSLNHNSNQKKQIAETIKTKSTQLLKGLKKHNQHSKVTELHHILKLTTPFLEKS